MKVQLTFDPGLPFADGPMKVVDGAPLLDRDGSRLGHIAGASFADGVLSVDVELEVAEVVVQLGAGIQAVGLSGAEISIGVPGRRAEPTGAPIAPGLVVTRPAPPLRFVDPDSAPKRPGPSLANSAPAIGGDDNDPESV